MNLSKTISLKNEEETTLLAQNIAQHSKIGDVIYLKGTLGMGKSSFARSFIRFLSKNNTLEVPSPTFTLVQTYLDSTPPVWHFDLYRLEAPDEIEETGIDEALSSAVSLIEWPERLGSITFPNTLEIVIESGETTNSRIVHLKSSDSSWNDRLKGFFE